MIRSVKWIVPVLVLALVGVADAAKDKKKKDGKAGGDINGIVLSVEKGNLKIRPGEGGKAGKGEKKGAAAGANNAQPTIVRIDNNTKVTVDGQPGNVNSLHPGQQVSVTSSNGVATSVDATMPKGKGGKGNKQKKNK
jgi:hypothetical protein